MIHEPDDDERARELYDRRRELMAAGEYLGAAEVLETSVLLAPHFKSLELLGESWLSVGEPRRAIVPLAAATALNNQGRAPALLAKALLASGAYTEARRMAFIANQRDPNNRMASEVLALTSDESLSA